MNSVNLVGNLVADVELTYNAKGNAFASFTLATNSFYDGKEYPSFHRCKAFGAHAENIAKATKGQKLGINGRGQSGSYKRDNGDTVYTYEIIVNTFDYCSNPTTSQDSTNRNQRRKPNQPF